ncbi:hypothetical protein ACO2Q0_03550 [Phenylobacterium sp. VNQ135]|uniref:hypothetical protein n=1 Tax=Phenylobacterium sp. VNQ135 TaxID=3400922 RepID=UPI003BFCDD97
MDKLIRTQDLKSLMWGAAGVAAVGLFAGTVMQPNLRAPGDVEGLQMQMGASGPRDYALGDPAASWTSYAAGIPEYVIGTDWLKAPQYETEPAPDYAADEPPSAFDEPAPASAQAVAANVYEEPAREPPHYPSMEGGRAYAVSEAAEAAVGVEPMETALDPESAELAVATPG